MSKSTAWITGAGGLIGSHLVRAAARHAPEWSVVPITREKVDLCNDAAVARLFASEPPQLILHCAAISRVGDCQANPELAEAVNVHATRHLCELGAEIPLVFFSTDLVFDGLKGGYVEADPVNPINVYAESKVRAEESVLKNPRHFVVRTSLNAGVSPTGNRSFTEDMLRAWERGQTLSLFKDEFRNPIHASVTARVVWELVRLNQPGLYHLAGAERLSRWEVGQLVATRWPHAQARMNPGSLRDYQGPRRSPDTSLNCAKLQSVLSFPLPGLRDWLEQNPQEPV